MPAIAYCSFPFKQVTGLLLSTVWSYCISFCEINLITQCFVQYLIFISWQILDKGWKMCCIFRRVISNYRIVFFLVQKLKYFFPLGMVTKRTLPSPLLLIFNKILFLPPFKILILKFYS